MAVIIFCESAALALMQQKLYYYLSLILSLSNLLLFFYFFVGIAYINIGINPISPSSGPLGSVWQSMDVKEVVALSDKAVGN